MLYILKVLNGPEDKNGLEYLQQGYGWLYGTNLWNLFSFLLKKDKDQQHLFMYLFGGLYTESKLPN